MFGLPLALITQRRVLLWDKVSPAKNRLFLPSRHVIPESAREVLHASKARCVVVQSPRCAGFEMASC